MALLKQHYSDGKMLTRQIFSTELDCIFSKLKLDRGSYNTHSFRIGTEISAIEAGIPETPIKILWIPGIRKNTHRRPRQVIKVVGIQVQAPQE